MKISLSALLLSLIISSSLFAQDMSLQKLTLAGKEKKTGGLIIEDKLSEISISQLSTVNKLEYLALNPPKNKFLTAESNMQSVKKKKSVGLGVLLSALVPGAGEFYGGNYLKAGIFFAVEMIAWGTYLYFNGKGNTKEDEYIAYADKYWDVRFYAAWLKNEGFSESNGINPNEPNRDILREQIIVCERANFSHTMPEYNSQQYYELIGKYQNFQAGWTNLANMPTKAQGPYWYETYQDPVFTNYAVERQKANDFFDYAKIGPITAIINHILSAADAAWVISTYNSKIKVETGFRMENKVSPYTYQIKQIPTFNLSVSF